MADPARRLMTPEEFFVGQTAQDGLYELVDGMPVPHVEMMKGASAQHDRATVTIIAALHAQLRGSGCRPTTDDLALRTGIATIRRPAVTVECGDLVRDIDENRTPRLVVEVLSPSTTDIDRFRKLDEYRRHPSLAYILLVETRFPSTVLYRPGGRRLALADLYEGRGLRAGPTGPLRRRYHMSRATRASSDIRLWSHGGSNTIVTEQDCTP
ncbi:Uma2 family endonuclease [Methylobacterium sp. B4]|uniref:Uma2 family endonuclease n=1 Tax=Methylobacterium sp. B4 TaxID=1938755 RepID=UPI000D97E732|nr:Uma2 family endonuclease [Methylobacterium sp. B4]PXW63046.1 Uma2 family endonuclease [Methylobacterium sp. B4]